MSHHTPGPWTAEEEERAQRTGAVVGIYVAQVNPRAPNGLNGRICQAYGNCLVTTDDELRANARLIAAAPELLEVCKAALATFEQGTPIDWRALASAVDNAEGKT
jgi:hypothetical protein